MYSLVYIIVLACILNGVQNQRKILLQNQRKNIKIKSTVEGQAYTIELTT
jgi:hypothetical protein